ncbi:hypothetical protein CLAIMM_00768 [Cladophialophora immunda]|nr:hypothetical protein CLAIMM_00768 [Cladophialophora immunda]
MTVDRKHWQIDKSAAAASVVLRSSSGCTYGVEFSTKYDSDLSYTATSGGTPWSTLSSFIIGNHATNTPTAAVHTGSSVNSSDCPANTELLFAMNNPILQDTIGYGYSENKHWQTAGTLCRYYQGDVPVNADLTQASSLLSFDEADYTGNRRAINTSFFDTATFQNLFLSRNWSYHFINPNASSPVNGGPMALLAARYNNLVDAMLSDPQLVAQASRLKQNFLGEVMQDAFSAVMQIEGVDGTVLTTRRRIIAVPVTAFTLGGTLGLQLLLIGVLATRISQRALELRHDLALVITTAAPVTEDSSDVRVSLEQVDTRTKTPDTTSNGGDKYKLQSGSLRLIQAPANQSRFGPALANGTKWRPSSLKIPALLAFTTVLIIVLVAMTILYSFSQRDQLYQTFLVYQASLRSSYSLWAALKAAHKGHWVLACLSFGSFLTQILTISLSALWQRDYGSVDRHVQVARPLVLRQVPFVSQGEIEPTTGGQNYQGTVLQSLYSNLETNWLYGAAIELSLEGASPAWSSDGWSFAPLNLVDLPDDTFQDIGSLSSALEQAVNPNTGTNVTVSTQAIRGRLEFSPYETVSNTSTWLSIQDPTNSSVWSLSSNPSNIEVGYELGAFLDYTEYIESWPGDAGDFRILPDFYTSFFVNPSHVQCCVNTSSTDPGPASIGFWSANLGLGKLSLWSSTNPYNFTVKWIHGSQLQQYKSNSSNGLSHMIWSEPSQMAALNCAPIIEIANSSVTVDSSSERVYTYAILDDPQLDLHAWSDALKTWSNNITNSEDFLLINITTRQVGLCAFAAQALLTGFHSYGILFLDALLTAADLGNIYGPDENTGYDDYTRENTNSTTFNIRSPGLNVDYMTYAMLSMVDYNQTAMLDHDTLGQLANRTFSTFFQHYASSNVTDDTGGWTWQKVNSTLPAGLGKPGNYGK